MSTRKQSDSKTKSRAKIPETTEQTAQRMFEHYVLFDKLLSIKKCRKILCKNGAQYTDEKVERIRDFLYLMAGVEVEYWNEEAARKALVTKNDTTES